MVFNDPTTETLFWMSMLLCVGILIFCFLYWRLLDDYNYAAYKANERGRSINAYERGRKAAEKQIEDMREFIRDNIDNGWIKYLRSITPNPRAVIELPDRSKSANDNTVKPTDELDEAIKKATERIKTKADAAVAVIERIN